jgi:nucleotide-binding universal stress UspA family protein
VDDETHDNSPPVVVGFDGRWQNHQFLLDRAAREAERRRLPLLLVTVLRRPGDLDPATPGVHPDDGHPDDGHTDDGHTSAAARRGLSDAVEALRLMYPPVPIRGLCLDEDDLRSGPAPLRSAALLALGMRGQFRQPAFLEGSISRLLLAAVDCPVLLLPDSLETRAPATTRAAPDYVLVGVGPDAEDAVLVQTALEEAARRHCEVHLLHSDPAASDAPDQVHLTPIWTMIRQARAEARLATGPKVSITLTCEPPGTALAGYSDGAAVLVVGTRPGSLAGLVDDSVSLALASSARCPVLAVPRDAATGIFPRPPIDLADGRVDVLTRRHSHE